MTEPKSVPPEAEVERICESPAFRRSPTQTRLLRFLTKEALAGRGRELNQYLIATDGMGLSTKFDPTTNSCVRVWGIRLRKMLEEFYSGSEEVSALRVRLPERSFCPVFEVKSVDSSEEDPREVFPKLAVIEFRGVGLRGSLRSLPSLLADKMVECLAAMDGVATLGPIERRRGDTPVELGRRCGADFLLDGSLYAVGETCRAEARFLRGETGVVCSAQSFPLKINTRRMASLEFPINRRLRTFIEDGLGTLWKEVERATQGKSSGQFSAKEAMMHVWHAYSTMSPRDITAAQKAIRSAQEKQK